MEYVDGTTLREHLHQRPQLTIEAKLRLIVGIARGLEYAHCCGIIHRDIKPENILIAADFTLKLRILDWLKYSDFDKKLTQTGEIIGTPKYMAPEQLQGQRKLDAGVDIYSLASCLYEMTTGTAPYLGETNLEILYQLASGPPQLPSHIEPSIAPAIEAIIVRGMESNRKRRYQNVAQMAKEIEDYLSNKPSRQRATWRKLRWQLKRKKTTLYLL